MKEKITCRNVNVTIKGKKILKNINLSIQEGESVALIGPNGAGKTTLLKTICGLLKPDCGKVLIEGKNIYNFIFSSNISNIKAFLEVPTAFDYLTCEDFLKYFLEMDGKRLNKEEVLTLFEEEEWEDLKNKRISQCSLGKRQKIFLSAILLCKPEILLLDEPTIALDFITMRLINKKINEYKRNHTLVISSHDFHFVTSVCDRIILIKDGEIIFDGYQKDVLKELRSSNTTLEYKVVLSDYKQGDKFKEIKTFSDIIIHIDGNKIVVKCTIERLQEFVRKILEEQIEIQEISPVREPLEVFFERYFN